MVLVRLHALGCRYWLVANSWNEGWGDQGYFKWLRKGTGSGLCSMESGGVAADVKL